MRALIQRVTEASVVIEGEVTGEIKNGLVVLLGIETADTAEDVSWLVKKIVQMRIFADAEGKMNLSVQDIGGNVLLVSQFTLFASIEKGNRPSFVKAAKPEVAVPLYEQTIREFESALSKPIQTGRFGADMKVRLVNDGPVTIWVDTKYRE
jgi:D-tyrosyl-tRNA(Tyr) deacylase